MWWAILIHVESKQFAFFCLIDGFRFPWQRGLQMMWDADAATSPDIILQSDLTAAELNCFRQHMRNNDNDNNNNINKRFLFFFTYSASAAPLQSLKHRILRICRTEGSDALLRQEEPSCSVCPWRLGASSGRAGGAPLRKTDFTVKFVKDAPTQPGAPQD